MVLGVGVDLLHRGALCRAFLVPGDPFWVKTYAPEEIAEAEAQGDPYADYERLFCMKEAVFKALGLSERVGSFHEIAILTGDGGLPRVYLTGGVGAAAAAKCVRSVLVSVSYENEMILSYAIAQDAESEVCPCREAI